MGAEGCDSLLANPLFLRLFLGRWVFLTGRFPQGRPSKGLHEAHHSVINDLDHRGKRVEYRPTVLERYVAGDCSIHVHLWTWGAAADSPGDVCIVWNKVREAISIASSSTEAMPGNVHLDATQDANTTSRCHEETVFVPVVEFSKKRQGVVLRLQSVLQSLVRLQFINHCSLLGLHTLQSAASLGGLPRFDGVTDRKLSLANFDSIISALREFENNVIQRASKVVHTVSDNDAQAEWRLGQISRDNPKRVGLGIVIGGDVTQLFLDECRGFDPQRCKVFFCPRDFDQRPIQGVPHSA